MRNRLQIVLASAALCASAAAGTFSVSGAGGPIPDCPHSPGPWNSQPTWPTLASSVTVNYPVTSITAVKLEGLAHTWRGDVHVFLADPNGVRHNLVVRPGFTGANSGDSGDYAGGDFTIVESGGASLAQGTADLVGGIYNQFLNERGGGEWTSGTYLIDNVPMGSITGPPGTWTLEIVDWFATDSGSLGGWTLEGNDASGLDPFCEPGIDAFPCPCANPPAGGAQGCDNFGAHSGGAVLSASGEARVSADSLVLVATGENPVALTVFFQSDTPAGHGGAWFGAGVRCIAGAMNRLYAGAASGGAIWRPGGADPSVSARSAALGDPISPSNTRYYMAAYRDPAAAGACADSASTFNCTQAGSLTWGL